MLASKVHQSVHRRGLLGALGRHRLSAAQAATETPEAEWTPPEIPQPLPTPGGAPPTPVGATDEETESPPEQVRHPISEVEGGTPSVPGAAVVEPFDPAVPAEDATPGATPSPPFAAVVLATPNFIFEPSEVTIRVGESVMWENQGRSPQTVTCDPARIAEEGLVQLPEGADPWDSGVLNSGDRFEHTFDVAGEYVYSTMNFAVDMAGRVIVEE